MCSVALKGAGLGGDRRNLGDDGELQEEKGDKDAIKEDMKKGTKIKRAVKPTNLLQGERKRNISDTRDTLTCGIG